MTTGLVVYMYDCRLGYVFKGRASWRCMKIGCWGRCLGLSRRT